MAVPVSNQSAAQLGELPRTPPPATLETQKGNAEDLVITQTLTRESTTFTTEVTLGAGPPESFTSPTSIAVTTSTDTGTPAETSLSTAINDSGGGLSSAQTFAILGSLCAFVVIVLIVWYFLTIGKRRARTSMYSRSDYDSSYLGSSSSPSSSSSSASEHPRRGDPWRRTGPPPAGRMPPRPASGFRPPPPMPNVRTADMSNINFARWSRNQR